MANPTTVTPSPSVVRTPEQHAAAIRAATKAATATWELPELTTCTEQLGNAVQLLLDADPEELRRLTYATQAPESDASNRERGVAMFEPTLLFADIPINSDAHPVTDRVRSFETALRDCPKLQDKPTRVRFLIALDALFAGLQLSMRHHLGLIRGSWRPHSYTVFGACRLWVVGQLRQTLDPADPLAIINEARHKALVESQTNHDMDHVP